MVKLDAQEWDWHRWMKILSSSYVLKHLYKCKSKNML